MKKIFNQKNFNNFVGTPLDSRLNIYINFCLQVHFKVSAASYCYQRQICHRYQRHRRQILPPVSLVSLPPVSLTPAANLPPA
jgi:hypothetical protein